MLNEILNILENVVTGIIPVTLVLYILYLILTINKKKSRIKNFISLTCITALAFSTMICMVFQIYQVGIIFDTYDTEQVLEPWVKTLSFLAVETFYSIIFVLGLFVIIYIENHQIIPGTGSVKNRLKYQWKIFKEELNEPRRKSTIERNKRKV